VVLRQGKNLELVYFILEMTGASLLAYEFKIFMGFGKLEGVES
jgi:hypothetical protein